MSERSQSARRLCLVGATGLVGSAVISATVERTDLRLIAVSRREISLPTGARLEVLVGDTPQWPALIAMTQARIFVCALGTTRKAAGSPAAFRSVDHDLVISSARAAHEAGLDHLILVSSVGADAASSNLYLRTKGEVENTVKTMGFGRVDILRPGLLRGRRGEPRPLERMARLLAPVADNILLHGKLSRYRSISARQVADVILNLSAQKARGRFVHEYDAMQRILRRQG